MITDPIPYAKIEDELGEPGGRDGLILRTTPFPLRLSWEATYITRVLIHERIADGFVSALEAILEYYGLEFLKENNLDEFGGTYNPRKSRGSGRWSVHSWAMAVDYLPSMGKFGVPAMTPAPVVDAFKAQGFLWGGDWTLPDGMHFTGIKE